MENQFSKYKFKHQLRDYQVRVLDEIPQYLDGDGKIHVVAAPGAGKTSLALQIIINFGKPTLVLAPTIVLREQWLDRFKEDFTNGEDLKDVISDNLNEPKLITAITYQSLYAEYAAVTKRNKASVIAQKLRDANISLIVLDEAHHLKSAWLDAANNMIKQIGSVTTISLTATPPYDLKQLVWKKYIGLCGDIDVEITVPELVRKKDLAPHQDYIYFNYPAQNQMDDVETLHLKIDELVKKTLSSKKLITAISLHDGIIEPSTKMEYFIEHFDYYLAMLKFLQANQIKIPQTSITIDNRRLPDFDLEDLETLLTYCLYQDAKSYADFSAYFKEIRKELYSIGAIVDKKVNLRNTESLKRRVTQNIGKLNSIKEIIRAEKAVLAEQLKLVIISDNIYKNALDLWEEEEFKQIGVIPIFASLVWERLEEILVLTGEIIIIPVRLTEALFRIACDSGVEKDKITIEELSFDFDYARIRFTGRAEKEAVGIVTDLFHQSDVHVMVGSSALIGEGWDAPFVNSLIMATSIASYVTSNQVRGRAIRSCKADAEKTANIWHLVCIEKIDQNLYVPGMDYQILKRRFEAFEGVGIKASLIDYGIDRLAIEEKTYTGQEVQELNQQTLNAASQRARMRANWNKALTSYEPVKINKLPLDTGGQQTGVRKNRRLGLVASYFGLIKLLVTSLTIIRKENTSSVFSLKNGALFFIGNGILKTLIQMNVINERAELIFSNRYGKTGFYLKNSTLKENAVFKKAFLEILEKVDNPRYVIERKGSYFAVPGLIGARKENVKFLLKTLHLSRGSNLIFTRNPEGREKLLMIKLNQEKVTANWRHSQSKPQAQLMQTKINVQVLQNELQSKNYMGDKGETK